MANTSIIPNWKYWLSHIYEFHIESAPSEINPHLYVSLKKGRLQLSAAHAVYSFEDLYTNFKIAFDKVKLPEENASVLVLGFGLGSIPQLLEQSFQKQYQYTAVEIDESVLYLANKYSLSKIHSSIDLICADARSFVEQSQEQFDLICMDVFLDDVIPNTLMSNQFLESLKKNLTPDGILLYNSLAYLPRDVQLSRKFFNDTFLPAFPHGTFIRAKGNWILLNDEKYLGDRQ